MGSSKEVELCPAKGCPLWERRFGRGFKGGYLRAIRKRCLDCKAGNAAEVRRCDFDGGTEEFCPLWPYRMGKRPKSAQLRTDECEQERT
jgi:hypothetical protein